MKRYKKGISWLNTDKLAPRLFLNEKNESIIKWVIRGLTFFGISISVITMPWLYSLTTSILLVLIDAFLEKTLFYYTTLYVTAMPDFKYDPEKWTANCFISLGHPSNPKSKKIVGLVFNDREYANNFFSLLKDWNHGSPDNKENNIVLTFIIDEDAYYVYLYPSFEKKSIKNMHQRVEDESKLTKYGKEHIGIVMSLIICKYFSTTNGFGLGMFIDNHPQNKPFTLEAFLHVEDGDPAPIHEIDAIKMYSYKAKIPSELADEDIEKQHWDKMIKRRSMGEHA